MIEERKKLEIRHDILFHVKKNAYIHKYREPFIAKHLDDAMSVLENVIAKRKTCTKRKIYCEFVDNETGKYVGKRTADYYPYVAAIGVSEKDIYDAIIDIRILAPAIVDVLGGLWWSIVNDEEDLRDENGKLISTLKKTRKRGRKKKSPTKDKPIKK